ncbi:glycosyltransferase [Empedobacter falsenii]
MNILFLLGTYPNYGGVEKVTTFLSNEFVKNNINVSIISFRCDIPSLLEELDDRINYYQFPQKKVLSLKNINFLNKIILNKNIDIILNQWCLPFYVTILCQIAIRNTNCKLYSLQHSPPNQNSYIQKINNEIVKNGSSLKFKFILSIVNIITKFSLKYVYNNSDKFIILSESFIKSFIEFVNIDNSNKLIVIPNPLTIPTNEDYNIFKNKKNEIIYVGRVNFKEKKVNRVVEVWSFLEKKFPSWSLRIVGDGPDLKKLKILSQNLNLKKVSFEGFSNPVEFYKSSKILILMSEYEGFGLVVLEGGNYGAVPVVYGSYDAVFDIIDNNKNGLIISKKDKFPVEEVANSIENLIMDDVLLENMSREAIKKSKSFEKEAIINLWIKLFNE